MKYNYNINKTLTAMILLVYFLSTAGSAEFITIEQWETKDLGNGFSITAVEITCISRDVRWAILDLYNYDSGNYLGKKTVNLGERLRFNNFFEATVETIFCAQTKMVRLQDIWPSAHDYVQNVISSAQNTIQSEKKKGFNLVEAETLLSSAQSAFNAGDYPNARSLAQEAKSKAEAISKEATPVKTVIDEARSAISEEKAKGFNVASAESLLSQAEQEFSSGDYSAAKYKAEQAKAKVIDILDLASSANTAISQAKTTILNEKSKGFNVADVEALFSQAEQALRSGDYSKAKSLAWDAKSKAETIGEKGTPAKTAIEDAKSVLSQEEAKGFNVAEAKPMLEDALQSFNANDFYNAKNYADSAKSIALDIDHDGVPNSEDFAPTIKNGYIFTWIVFLLFGTILTLGFQHERQRKKKMKKEILDKIKEVTTKV